MTDGYFFDMNGLGQPAGYSIRAVAQFGDNDGGGDAELLLGGTSWASYVAGQTTWNPDTNADGSWDSGWVPVQLTLAAGGGADGVDFSVAGSAPGTITDSGEAYGEISSVTLIAAAQAQGTFQWSNVLVEFGNASGVIDTYNRAAGPSVDTRAMDPNNASAEAGLNVNSNLSGITTVTVLGNVRMTSPNGPYLNTADLFGEVLIYTR